MEHILNTLKQYVPLTRLAIEAFENVVTYISYPEKTILLQQGKYSRNLFFLKSGFARGFYSADGKEVTTWFAAENDILVSFHAFITQKPSYESIELLAPCTLVRISYDNLQNLYKTYEEFNTIGRLITEKYYIDLEERTRSLQLNSAKERYDILLKTQPDILQNAPLSQIASYLGMTQETLSRVRRKN